MSGLTEIEILDRHKQALSEARQACQYLGYNEDPEYIALRGPHYKRLKEALDLLEGSARQMSAFRSDARWLRIGIHYAKVMRFVQRKFVRQAWGDFTRLMPMFENGLRQMEDLATRKTGTTGIIIPANPSSFLILPDHMGATRGPGTVH